MSHSSINATLETSSEDASYSFEPNLVENSNQTWENLKLTNSLDTPSKEYNLLKSTTFSISSPLGDLHFGVGITKYTLDRAILASKSHHLCHYLTQYEEDEFGDRIKNDLTHDDNTRFSNIVDIIYGKQLEIILTENNFSQLFEDIYSMGLQIDLKIFKEFIDEKIKPKAKFSTQMFHLYRILILNDHHAYDYLLPTVTEHISDHLLEIYDRKIFLSLSVKRFTQILFNKSENSHEKGSISRICAEWICYDFRNRIIHLKDLVNVAKYRYGLIPYSDWAPLTRSWQDIDGSGKPQVQEVEQYFDNLLLFNHGEVSYVFPANLKDELTYTEPGAQVVHFINQIDQWMSFLREGIFSDVEINVRGTIFKLHRVKLVLASEYFQDLFTDQIESSSSNAGDKSISESTTKEYFLDHIDPVTFQSIIRYIYEHEIEVTSQSHLISLIKGSEFLKMNDLFEKCFSMMLKIARNDVIDVVSDIFEVFQYASENARYSELYGISAAKVISLWSKHEEKPHFEKISLRTLKEILALPNLTLKTPDEVVSLCAEWIFFDIENRLHHTIEVAKAINRNFTIDNDKFKLEIPLDTNYSLKYVEEQLDKILSSTTLVSFNMNSDCAENEWRKPKFLFLNDEKFLKVVDVNFNEIVQLARIDEPDSQYSATMINDKLFVLFNIGEKFYFQCYSLATSKLILLATDAKMDSYQNYVILNCNNEIYYCDECYMLKYIPNLNRWIPFLDVYVNTEFFVKYTSDGKNIYKVFRKDCYNTVGEFAAWLNIASFYDFHEKKWIALPKISFVGKNSRSNTKDNKIIKVNIINHELCVLLSSKTQRFNWLTQTWKDIFHHNENFVEFTEHEKRIVYISEENEVLVYSPVFKEWTVERKVDNFSNIVAIHTLEQ